MKVCSSWGTQKSLENFFPRYGKRKGSFHTECKFCFNKRIVKRGQENKRKAVDYKGGKCELCGYNKYEGALQFHHLNPKEKDPKWKTLRLCSWEKLKIELDKCQLLCANCHAEVHYGQVTEEADGPDF